MNNIDLAKVENLIFDLGEVIIDVDTTKTVRAFSSLSYSQSFDLFSFQQQATFFNAFEKGLISESEFRSEICNALQKTFDDTIIDEAWNAMLGELPQQKLETLNQLKKMFKVFALSNTNSIHIRAINERIASTNKNDCLENYFHHAYYSHNLHERKPDEAAFLSVLEREGLDANKTLMIDDRIENIETAQKLGMQVFQMNHPNQFYDLFKKAL